VGGGRREKYDPIAAREHSLATLYPSKSSLIVIPTALHQPAVEIQSQRLVIRFTRRVRHDISSQISLTI
jgi:hypothetical protein